jgi:hypothetical protein
MSAPMRSAFGIVLGLMVSLSVACGGHKQTSGPFLDPQTRADVARVTTCFNAVLSAYGQWAYTFGDVGQSEILRTYGTQSPEYSAWSKNLTAFSQDAVRNGAATALVDVTESVRTSCAAALGVQFVPNSSPTEPYPGD